MGEILQTTSKLYSFETKRFMFGFKFSWISNWQIISIVSISRCYMIAKHESVWPIEEKLLAVPYHSSMLLINITSIQIIRNNSMLQRPLKRETIILNSTDSCHIESHLKDISGTHDDVIKWKHFRVTGPLCGKPPVTGEFPSQRPVTRNLYVFFNLRLE